MTWVLWVGLGEIYLCKISIVLYALQQVKTPAAARKSLLCTLPHRSFKARNFQHSTKIYMLLLQRHTLLRLLFCLCSTTVAAQNPNLMPGYYITPQGEKVIGTLNITKWRDNTLKFKSAGYKHWKKLRPADVHEAGSDSGLSFLTQGVKSGR